MTKTRMFSVPYNGSDPENFIKQLDKFKKHVENVFLAPPLFSNNHANISVNIREKSGDCYDYVSGIIEYDKNCYRFLELTEGKYKRIVAINSAHYSLTDADIQMFVMHDIAKLVENYKIDGLILTDFNMARFVHQLWPGLELHTSCNCFQWNIRQMKLWQKECGISVFNPPREILRTPEKLKEMHEAGFKLKCIVNEGCLYGCPQTINHCMMRAVDKFSMTNCLRNDYVNVLKANYVLPRWLDKLDEYVDIYKIAGRGAGNTQYIFDTLENYINGRDDLSIKELVFGGVDITFYQDNNLGNITLNEIPDKLLTCECKECDDTCFLCRNLVNKYLDNL